jgi:hypothetical protein
LRDGAPPQGISLEANVSVGSPARLAGRPDQGGDAEKAERDQPAREQTLRHPARGGRRSPLVGAEVEGEKGGQQREAARVDDREAAGDERDRERTGADRDLLTASFYLLDGFES